MNAVGNRADRIVRKHLAGYLAVLHRDAIHKSREAQRNVGHVQQAIVKGTHPLQKPGAIIPENPVSLLRRKAVVARRNRRMRREDAALPYRIDVLVAGAVDVAAVPLLLEKRHRKQRGMALVHVIHRRLIAQGVKNARATHAQHGFLAQAVIAVAAVKTIRQLAVHGIVFFEIRIEKINGNNVPGNTLHVVSPGADRHTAALNCKPHNRLFCRKNSLPASTAAPLRSGPHLHPDAAENIRSDAQA